MSVKFIPVGRHVTDVGSSITLSLLALVFQHCRRKSVILHIKHYKNWHKMCLPAFG
jgi:hypothetical protein